MTATWAAVTADVAGVALGIDGYELFARINQAGALWMQIAVTDETTAAFSPLVVGESYAFKVRATSAGVKGEFSEQIVKVIPDDVTPPPVPSAPQVSTRLGVIHVGWDGLGVGGEVMPSDFLVVRVWMQDPLAPGPVLVGHLDESGSVVVPGQPYGADRELWFTSIDRSGNESAASARVVAATQSIVDTDLIGQIIDGAEHIIDGTIPADAKITAGTITGGLIRAGEIEAGHIKSNAITSDKIAAGQIEAGHIAAGQVNAGHLAANSVTSDKIQAQAIDGKTITGAWIRTAVSGKRLELAPPGSPYPEMRFYPTNSTNYTRLRTRDDQFAGEATFEITSGTNQGRTAASQTTIAAGWMQMQVRDSSLDSPNGGRMELAESYAQYGFYRNSANEQYFWFDGTGRTRHVGKWWDFTSLGPTAGIMAGSLVVSSGNSGVTISYGATMSGNMGPVASVRDGASNPNFYWCGTSSNQSSFIMSWSQGGGVWSGKAIYWWSHRH